MKRLLINDLEKYIDSTVCIQGWVHRVRILKSISFIILRDRSGLVQCIVNNSEFDSSSLTLESIATINGLVVKSNNKLNSFEVQINTLEIINKAMDSLPIEVNKNISDINLDTMLNNRVLSLRNKRTSAIFKVQNIMVNAFRNFLNNQGFTEIYTPKIVKEGAEGGSDVFEVKYFDRKAFLAQSPQFYKQMMVGAGFEMVFEVGHAYRAEEHSTNRHLNEYVSLDLEMGFINDEYDVINLEEELLKYILTELNTHGS